MTRKNPPSCTASPNTHANSSSTTIFDPGSSTASVRAPNTRPAVVGAVAKRRRARPLRTRTTSRTSLSSSAASSESAKVSAITAGAY